MISVIFFRARFALATVIMINWINFLRFFFIHELTREWTRESENFYFHRFFFTLLHALVEFTVEIVRSRYN